jgi:hypothetical protein
MLARLSLYYVMQKVTGLPDYAPDFLPQPSRANLIEERCPPCRLGPSSLTALGHEADVMRGVRTGRFGRT